MQQIFSQLAGVRTIQPQQLQINHRFLSAEGVANGVLLIEFSALCGDARSQNDYVELAKLFHTVLLVNVPVMDVSKENQARRFLALVDEFYERHVKLIVNASAPPSHIYKGEKLCFEYQRCLSRLVEMQSTNYLALTHLI